MANFQRTPGDKTTRLDKDSASLALVLEEHAKIDLWGGGPGGIPLVVDSDDRGVVEVSDEPVAFNGSSWLSTYGVAGMNSGNTRITARLLDQCYADIGSRRRAWSAAPIWASLQVTVFGAEYRQGGGTWGNLTYGSMNPAWKNVKWTTMGEAGCGPTSLADVLDYLDRISPTAPRGPMSYAGITPKNTMDYTSRYGRAADDKGVPQGTSGKIMVDNISRFWPEYSGRAVASLEEAKILLRSHHPIVFLAKNTVTWKYDSKGNKNQITWPGHFMVVLGYEGNGDPFWISDPSRFQSKFISADELKKCAMWVVTRIQDDGNSCSVSP
jgi:Peptidase_C39 like family